LRDEEGRIRHRKTLLDRQIPARYADAAAIDAVVSACGANAIGWALWRSNCLGPCGAVCNGNIRSVSQQRIEADLIMNDRSATMQLT
jgi:hypothetical protein